MGLAGRTARFAGLLPRSTTLRLLACPRGVGDGFRANGLGGLPAAAPIVGVDGREVERMVLPPA